MAKYGADTLRLYEMFMGPLDASIAWNENGLEGSRKFLDRVWRLIVDEEGKMRDRITTINDGRLTKVYHQTVKKVTEDMVNLYLMNMWKDLSNYLRQSRHILVKNYGKF